MHRENVQRYRAEIMADILHVQYEVAVSGEENWSLLRQTIKNRSCKRDLIEKITKNALRIIRIVFKEISKGGELSSQLRR